MASSMMTGEQRWASKRRGGMTVLGKVAKVAVPKPLNLPSQRLENHGLDPNVEIVPKGTLSWGSRPSSSGSNAWATAALSPSTDGGSSSPRQLGGRPLSGGGTRPSTASSEKAHDSSAWGPNSRPSSASGVLGSNHATLTSLRPHSADTRPGSSQLSRFAEHSPEGSGALGTTASTERMGVNEGFSLSSGDFPTLGSEKEESRSTEPLDSSHGRPGSSSGGMKSMSDSMEIAHDDARDSDVKGHSWTENCPPFVEGGPRPSMERWRGDPHMYPHPNMCPPHYDSWRGPPSVNPQGGVWYRGPPAPLPYGGPAPPGSFHMDPYPYYPPQVPPPGPPHGHHPTNGDMYRPHLAESFMGPGVPMRPGFYPGPVPYEGYNRPPMPFCNPNERDLPFMGIPPGPIHNRPKNQNVPELNRFHPRSHEGRGPDQVDPNHLHDPRGNYKVLVKHNDVENQNDQEKWGHSVSTDRSNREKGILSNATLQENSWGDDYKKPESLNYGQNAAAKEEVPSRPRNNRFHSSNSANSKVSGSVSNVRDPSTTSVTDDLGSSRDHSLIQKIDGLNAKARATGGNQDVFHREELTERVQGVNDWAHQSVGEADTEVVLERHYPTGVLVPVSRDNSVIASEKSGEPILIAGPRRAMHGAPNRGNHHGRGNFDEHDVSKWGKKPQPHSFRSAGYSLTTNDQVEDNNSAVQPTGVRMANIEMKGDGESATSTIDHNDTQRAKMREIAKQRAIELQKEEEERIREQKAKALAKLEELNRRSATQVVEVPNEKDIVPPCSTGSVKPDDSRDQPDLEANSNTEPNSGSSNKSAQMNENGASNIVNSVATSSHARDKSKKNAHHDSVSSQNQSFVNSVDADGNRTTAQVRDVPKHKRVGNKPRQSIPPEKNISQKSITVAQTDVLVDYKAVNVNHEITFGSIVIGAGNEILETPLDSDSHAPQKRRNSKNGKNKHKVEDTSSAVSLPNNPSSAGKNTSDLHGNSTAVQLPADSKEPSQFSGNHSSLSREDDHSRVNNSWKAQNSRKPRSSHGRLSEKGQNNDAVVWAPVRALNKVEVPDKTNQKGAGPLPSSAVVENVPQNSPKAKRAEMERYVPKPKELAQQGSIQKDSSVESGGREKACEVSDSVPKAGSVVEGKNKHAKGQGAWRQRVSVDSNPVQASQHSSVDSTTKNRQPSGGQTVSQLNRPAELSMKEPEVVFSDGWNIVDDPSSISSAAYTGMKDQFPSGKGKRHPFKGQRGSGNYQSSEHKDSNANLTDSHVASEINHTEKSQLSKENRTALDRSESHWQPKSHVNATHNQQGKWSRGGKSHAAEDGNNLKPDIEHRSGFEDKAMQDMGNQEYKREKRGLHVKGRSNPSSHRLQETEVEPALLEGADGRTEQRPSSGYRKNSNYGGRVNKVYESRGDWNAYAPENKQYYSAGNQERQRQNSQYEYQAVGSYNSNDSEPQFENQHGGPRFRGRGYSRRGRGNFHGRQGGNE